MWCWGAGESVGNECPQTKSAERVAWESMPGGVSGPLTQAVPQITASPPSAGTLCMWTPDGGVDLVRSDSGRSSRIDHPKSEINECPQTKSAEPSTRESMPVGVRGLVTTGSRRGRQTRSIGVRRWSRSRSTGLRTVESTSIIRSPRSMRARRRSLRNHRRGSPCPWESVDSFHKLFRRLRLRLHLRALTTRGPPMPESTGSTGLQTVGSTSFI